MNGFWRFTLQLVAVLLCASTARAELRVVATTTDLAHFARAVGGDRVHVDTICRGKQDPHFVQARPSYMVKLSRADLLLAVGLELEAAWLPLLIQGARNPTIKPGHRGFFEAASTIQAIDVPTGPIDRSAGDVHPLGNPHFWLDPDNARKVATAVALRLAELDPDNAKLFARNQQTFDQGLTRAMERWSVQMAPLRGKKIVSYHRTFNYFHRRFGLVGVGYVEERPGIPPAPAHLARLIRKMRSDEVSVIFHESFYNRAMSDLVARKSNSRVLVLPTSVDGVEGTSSYEELIDYIIGQATAGMDVDP